MEPKKSSKQQNVFTTLRQFIRERAPVEKCEMCGSELGTDHCHLFESSSRQLVCTCDKCIILFGDQNGHQVSEGPATDSILAGLFDDRRTMARADDPG